MNWLLFLPAATMSTMVGMMARVATEALLDVEASIVSGPALILLGFVLAFHLIFLVAAPFALVRSRSAPAFSLTILLGFIGYGFAGLALQT